MTTATERLTFGIPDGVLSVLRAGEIDAPVVLFLHGIPTNALLFREVMPIVAQAGFQVFAPDMPGYGKTRLRDGADYSLSAVADRYAHWLEAEHLAPLWLIGHDLGSAVAQMIAVRHAHLLSHLTLSNSPVGNSFPVFGVRFTQVLAKTGILPLLGSWGLLEDRYTTNQLREGFADPTKLTNDMLHTIFWDDKIREKDAIKEFAKHLKHLRNAESVVIVPQLAQISVPILVLSSALDRFQPGESVGQRLLQALPPDTAYDEVPDAGHFAPIEQPVLYAQALLNWRQIT
ncbi:MAG: alpha/beta fold hydrolase [Anaerolineae bacterium]